MQPVVSYETAVTSKSAFCTQAVVSYTARRYLSTAHAQSRRSTSLQFLLRNVSLHLSMAGIVLKYSSSRRIRFVHIGPQVLQTAAFSYAVIISQS
jgi:hypothetical protein